MESAAARVMTFPARLGLVAALALSARALPAWEPLALAGGRVTLGGELSGTLAPDDPGFFNYDDYEYSLRRFRLSLAAQVRAGDHLALLGEVLSENGHSPRAYALYLRARPWRGRSFDLQAGLIPPVFGGFPRRRYSLDNPLIGPPLAYQYLTSLRADALPATAEELEMLRGGGWLVAYPLGDPEPGSGLPLVNAQRWDAGVEARIGSEPISLSVALTQGTLSNPRVRDDNDGKQLAARLAWQPLQGLVLGASGARGAYLARELLQPLPDAGRCRQRAWGADLEYSRGYGLLRAEAVWSEWDLPARAALGARRPLRATGLTAEARYKLRPGLYLAGRADHLGFGRLRDAPGSPGWDAPVTRLEAGVGFSPHRNVLLKAVYQHNRRDGGFVRKDGMGAAQLVVWY